jgi:hypothetical protein
MRIDSRVHCHADPDYRTDGTDRYTDGTDRYTDGTGRYTDDRGGRASGDRDTSRQVAAIDVNG